MVEIQQTTQFTKSFESLPTSIQKRTVKTISLFKSDPHHPSLRNHKLKGKLSHLRSISVTMKYRILFTYVEDEVVLILDIGIHELYR